MEITTLTWEYPQQGMRTTIVYHPRFDGPLEIYEKNPLCIVKKIEKDD